MATQPTIFVSHGSPSLVIDGGKARDFLSGLGAQLTAERGKPDAVVCVSAHWDTRQPAVSAAPQPETIHDFGGFPDVLYRLRYPAPGDPALAARISDLLREAGLPCVVDPRRGLDHGAWSPLMLIYPKADIPVLQVSVQSPLGARHHAALGRALASLREENMLLFCSGSATHNLYDFGRYAPDAQPAPYAREFDDWLTNCVSRGAREDIVEFKTRAPEARRNHPSDEHFLPMIVAAGSATDPKGRVLHDSFTYGVLSMAAFAYD